MPTYIRFRRWLSRLLNRPACWGVVANRGRIDRRGFYSWREAQDWALRQKLMNWETYQYDERTAPLPASHYLRDS